MEMAINQKNPDTESLQQINHEKPLVQQFHAERNKVQIDFEELVAQDLDLFSTEQVQDIKDLKDAYINDPELFRTKKHLLDKFTPLSLIHALNGKFPSVGINLKASDRKNPSDGATILFGYLVNLPNSSISGFSEEPKKQLAQQRACQYFLKNLFPPGTTWREVTQIVQHDKEKMCEIFDSHTDKE